jgi:hypothetical protein
MNRRAIVKSLSGLTAFARFVRAQDQAAQQPAQVSGQGRGRGPSMPIPRPTRQASYPGRLKPGVVVMSFRGEPESGQLTYEDIVKISADLGLEGLDMTSYYVPPLLKFPPGVASQVVSEMVCQTPANPSSQWLASLRSTAYKNNFQIYTIGTPVKMSHETPELRQKEVAFGKKWSIWRTGWARGTSACSPAAFRKARPWNRRSPGVEVYKQILDYAAEKGIFVGVEDDDELTRALRPRFSTF